MRLSTFFEKKKQVTDRFRQNSRKSHISSRISTPANEKSWGMINQPCNTQKATQIHAWDRIVGQLALLSCKLHFIFLRRHFHKMFWADFYVPWIYPHCMDGMAFSPSVISPSVPKSVFRGPNPQRPQPDPKGPNPIPRGLEPTPQRPQPEPQRPQPKADYNHRPWR